tara:strand:+ start:163 stop:753 length:591 start_codon:yes stop_codon:yes gene_type:complete
MPPIKSENVSWQFQTDKINLYAFKDNFLSAKECDLIIKIGNEKKLQIGNTKDDNKTKSRKSNISWLSPSDNLDWLYRRLTDQINYLNDKYFGFDIFGIQEGLQFTNYKAPDGKYDSHTDRAYGNIIRKLSISIQLTNEDNYDGGDLELLQSDKADKMDKQQGKLIMFPSFVQHRVTPVTKGERNSLVIWVTGNNFK